MTGGGAVLGLDHVGLACADLERAVEFYCRTLGIPLRDRGELDGGSAARVVGRAELRGRFADLDLGAGRTLELFEIHVPSGPALAPDPLVPGGGHLSLRVRDLDSLVDAVRTAGYELRSPGPVTLDEPGFWHGARAVYVVGPDDVVVELIEWSRATPA